MKVSARGEPIWAPLVRGLLWPAALVTHSTAQKRAAMKKAQKTADSRR
jgi:hypothetical protein